MNASYGKQLVNYDIEEAARLLNDGGYPSVATRLVSDPESGSVWAALQPRGVIGHRSPKLAKRILRLLGAAWPDGRNAEPRKAGAP